MKRIKGQTKEGIEATRALENMIGQKGEGALKKALGVKEMIAIKVLDFHQTGFKTIRGRVYRIA